LGRRPQVEALESRTLMAGNVTASLAAVPITATGAVAEALSLQGDNGGNSVEVTIKSGATAKSEVLAVIGLNGTTVNGKAEADFAGVSTLASLSASLGQGDNSLQIDNLMISGDLAYAGGKGADALSVTGTTIGGSALIKTGDGTDQVSFAKTTIDHRLEVAFGSGNDLLQVSDSKVKGRTDITTGTGNDTVKFLGASTFGRKVTALGGGGQDVLDLGPAVALKGGLDAKGFKVMPSPVPDPIK
jgi:hypothetical protein